MISDLVRRMARRDGPGREVVATTATERSELNRLTKRNRINRGLRFARA